MQTNNRRHNLGIIITYNLLLIIGSYNQWNIPTWKTIFWITLFSYLPIWFLFIYSGKIKSSELYYNGPYLRDFYDIKRTALLITISYYKLIHIIYKFELNYWSPTAVVKRWILSTHFIMRRKNCRNH